MAQVKLNSAELKDFIKHVINNNRFIQGQGKVPTALNVVGNAGLGKTTIGQMVNLMPNDVSRFDWCLMFLHYLWVGPLQTLIITCILLFVLGPSCLIGIAILILFVPLQSK